MARVRSEVAAVEEGQVFTKNGGIVLFQDFLTKY